MEVKQEQSYKKKKRNYVNTNYYTAMKKSFNETDRTKIKELKDMQDKYDFFLMIYEQHGVKKYVPFWSK